MFISKIEEVIEIIAHDLGAVNRIEPAPFERVAEALTKNFGEAKIQEFSSLVSKLSIADLRTVAIDEGTEVASVYRRNGFSLYEQRMSEDFLNFIFGAV